MTKVLAMLMLFGLMMPIARQVYAKKTINPKTMPKSKAAMDAALIIHEVASYLSAVGTTMFLFCGFALLVLTIIGFF